MDSGPASADSVGPTSTDKPTSTAKPPESKSWVIGNLPCRHHV